MADTPDMGGLVEIEDPSFGQVLACVLSIQGHEGRTYLALLDNPGSIIAELVEMLNRDRNSVNRSLIALLDKSLIERKRRLLDPGGYVYQYTVTPLPEAKGMMHVALGGWTEDVHARISTFGES